MICPKCSREMGSEKNVCDFCGFTFQTPKNNDGPHTAPYSDTPFTGPASDGYTVGAAPDRPTVQIPPPVPPYPPVPPRPPIHFDPYAAYKVRSQDEPLSIGQYLGMILLSLIPVVGLIVMIVWAASRSTNVNRKHFAGAILILKALNLLFILGACVVFFVYHTPLFFYVFR